MNVASARIAVVSRVRTEYVARLTLLWLAPLVVLSIGIVLGLSLGAVSLSPARVFAGLTSSDDTVAHTIVWDLRLPRVMIAVIVGACLATSGVLLQGVTRNPLADPHILGLTAGGGLAATLTIRVAESVPSHLMVPIAFGGALTGAAIVYGMSWRQGVEPVRLALAGVAVASLLTAGTTMVLVTSDLRTQAALSWLAGGLFGRGWEDLRMLWPYAGAGLVAALLLTARMNILSLGDEAAQSLGLPLERSRLAAIAVAAWLAGAAVSVAGMVAFVGLVVPHVARFATGDDHRTLLPLSVIIGAALVLYADTLARVVLAPVEIPLGIVTAAVGAPFFMYLIRMKA
jgi:iron complex transport system permease protein